MASKQSKAAKKAAEEAKKKAKAEAEAKAKAEAEAKAQRAKDRETSLGDNSREGMVSKEGSKTKDTTLGDVREINPVKMAEAREVQAARIADAERVNAPSIGDVERYNGASVAPASTMSGSQLNLQGDAAFRQRQLALADALTATAEGRGPSVAGLQMREATDRGIAQNMAQLATMRGLNPGQAARLQAQAAGSLNQDAAMKAAQLKMAEAINAQQQLAGVTAQGREVETNQAAQQAALTQQAAANNQAALNRAAEVQAGLTQQAAQANQSAANQRQLDQAQLTMQGSLSNQLAANTRAQNQAQLEQQAATDSMNAVNTRNLNQANFVQAAQLSNQAAFNQRNIAQGQISGGIQQSEIGASATMGAAEAAANASRDVANIAAEASVTNNAMDNATQQNQQGVNNSAGYDHADTGANRDAQQRQQEAAGGIINGASGIVAANAASDKRFKKDIKGASGKIDEFLKKLDAKEFEYKNPEKHGKGKQVGVMAQDLEKTPIGKQMVEEHADGKYVNFQKGLAAILAAQASLRDRIAKLEGKGRA